MSQKKTTRRERRAAIRASQRSERSHAALKNAPARRPISLSQAFFSGRALWICLALIALNAVVYFPVHRYPFISLDDPEYVSANANVARGLTWSGVEWALTSGTMFYWHPLTWLSHMIDVQL